MSRTRKFNVTDYSQPGAGVPLGAVRAFSWDEAFAKASAKWPGRQLQVGA